MIADDRCHFSYVRLVILNSLLIDFLFFSLFALSSMVFSLR
jgi:hypothetical protein